MSDRVKQQKVVTQRYYFPRLSITVTPIPKAGGTSLLRLFIATEAELEQHGSISQNFIDTQEQRFSEIKSPWGQDGRRFRIPESPATQDASMLSVTVVRNPYQRLGSAWLNKFFMSSSIREMRNIRKTRWLYQVDSISMRDAFEQFVTALSEKASVLARDEHLRAQSDYVDGDSQDSLVVGLHYLDDLPTILQEYVAVDRIAEILMPHENATQAGLSRLLWTEASLRTAETVYGNDFKMITSLAHKFPRLTSELKRPDTVVSEPPMLIAEHDVLKMYLLRIQWAYTVARTENKRLVQLLKEMGKSGNE